MAIKAFPPCTILKELYLTPLDMSPIDLAQNLALDPVQSEQLANGILHVSAELALCLSRAFSTTPEFWMNMQTSYDLQQALASPLVQERLGKIQPL